MSGVGRFLSVRKKNRTHSPASKDKDKDGHSNPPLPRAKPPVQFGGVFTLEDDPKVKPDKEEEKRIQGILERLRAYGINTLLESNARYALRITSSHGDGEEAFRLLMLLQETYDGIVRPYTPNTILLGAVNRDSVTCYLDALLFAMFSRLDSFEAMLYENFEDLPRRKLAGLLRLWVNMLRTGRLITTDVTRHVQEALSECGWTDAAKLRQQDPSEAFTFITGQLELPLLTLKMDLHHAGKEDPQDDHKFVNERLLEVALPDGPEEGSSVITLEYCLEHYFNNRIEVKRHMENQRRNTLKSADASLVGDQSKVEKSSGIHIEVAEIGSGSNTPMVQTPIAETPTFTNHMRSPVDRIRPTAGRKRGNSIFSQRKVELYGVDPEKPKEDSEMAMPERERKLSTRTEVLMPAWQFFKLLPWYTDHMPTSDAQVAAHFSKQRPVLGICLKRYSYSNTGHAARLDTYVDIPLEITVPNFVSDEQLHEEGPIAGNFRLLLQSVVCHRGVSVHSGHYVSLCRGRASNATESRRGSSDSDEPEDPWMRFDDLARERVTYVDIREALKQETPYLLFYQVQPVGGDEGSVNDQLPSYAETLNSQGPTDVNTLEKPDTGESTGSEQGHQQVPSTGPPSYALVGSDSNDFALPTPPRASLDAGSTLDGPRGRTSFQGDDRRTSITFADNTSLVGSVSGGSIHTDPTVSIASTPSEEKNPDDKTNGLLGVGNMFTGSRRGSKVSKTSNSKSRPPSAGPDGTAGRFSLNMTKLTQKISRNDTPPSTTTAIGMPSTTTSAVDVTGLDKDSAEAQEKHDLLGRTDSMPLRPSIDTSMIATPVTEHGTAGKATTTHMFKKDKAASKAEKKRLRKGEEDRECVLM